MEDLRRRHILSTFHLTDHYLEMSLEDDRTMRMLVDQRDAALADVEAMEEILGNLWLYIKWQYVTKQLTTEQKERFADAVDASQRRMCEAENETYQPIADRWWRQ